MNTTVLKRVAIGASVAAVLLLVAALVFVATFDVNRYVPQIAQAVHARTGRTLRFDGDLRLSLFPRLAIRLPATTLSEPGRADVFARLQSARAGLALLPLVRRELQVDDVRIDGLQATVVRQKDGSTNIDDLLQANAPPDANAQGAPPAAAGATSSPRATTIGHVELKNADLTWRDLGVGRSVRLAALDLEAGRYAAGVRMPIEASADVTSDAPAFAGKLRAKADVEWGDAGRWRGLRDLALSASGRLDRRPLSIEAHAGRFIAAADALDVRALEFVASTHGDAATPIELRLRAPRIEASAARAEGEPVELRITRRGDQPLEAKAVIGGLHGRLPQLQATSVKVTGTARAGARSLRYDMTSPVAANIDARTFRFDGVAGEVALDDAAGARPLRVALTGNGALDIRRESLDVQFEGRGDGLAARGKVAVAGLTAPRTTFEIDADQVDADRYLLTAAPSEGAPASAGPNSAPPAQRPNPAAPGSARPAAATAPKSPGPAAATPEAEVDFSALRLLDASGTLRIARLRLKDTDVTDVRATVRAAAGHVDVAPFSLHVHGGAVDGRLGIDADARRVAAAGTLDGIQLKRLAGALGGGRVALEGSARGSFDVAAAGATTGQMKRALNGRVRLDVRDGALVGIDLGNLVGSAAAFLQSRGQQGGALDETRRTPFSQLGATFVLKDGVATNDDLKATAPQLDLSGSGRIDLVNARLDYALRALVVSGPATAQSDLRSLAGMTVPVHIAGPLSNPTYAVDWAPVAAELLARRAGGRTGSPAVNQVLEGLGDLLRRKK